MAHQLGPQCLTCKKRQVKCDSREPLCQRCDKDGRNCRGYKHDLKIVIYQPKDRGNSTSKRKSRESVTGDQVSQEPAVVGTSTDGALPTLHHSIPPDADYLALLESFQYYEKFVLPYTLPSRVPFRRTEIDRSVPWHTLPKLLIHCMILSLRSMRVSVYSPDPSTRRDLCHYRGLGLSGIQRILADAVSDTSGLALGCVLLLMGADLLISPAGSWTAHFEAARKITHFRGGMARCLEDMPTSRNLLVTFMVTDILSGSTCPKADLRSKYCLLSEYGSLLRSVQPDLLRQGFLCPPEVLEAISRINALRAGILESHWGKAIRASVKAFDASKWVANVLSDANDASQCDHNTFLVLTSLAKSYQAATLLYLELTCLDTYRGVQACYVEQELDSNIGVVFDFAATTKDGPLHNQLWKFLQWPLFVSAYVQIGWVLADVFEGTHSVSVAGQIERIKATGIAQGSARLVTAAQHLLDISLSRLQKSSWEWDDGFPSRCSFGL